MIAADLTPVYLIFEDNMGREYKALALVAPLRTQDMEELDGVHLAIAQDLRLKVKKMKVIKKG